MCRIILCLVIKFNVITKLNGEFSKKRLNNCCFLCLSKRVIVEKGWDV